MRDEEFMRLAIEKAREGIGEGQLPFGACLVRDGRVVSCEHNSVYGLNDATAHAEVRAIRTACRVLGTIDLTGCVIYSTTEPCPLCFSACHWARISKIVYGTEIADSAALGFSELTITNEEMKRVGGSPVEIVGGFMREENVALLREWVSKGLSGSY
jgi:tRNA(Arg) A34 adenosine deaminase TadA